MRVFLYLKDKWIKILKWLLIIGSIVLLVTFAVAIVEKNSNKCLKKSNDFFYTEALPKNAINAWCKNFVKNEGCKEWKYKLCNERGFDWQNFWESIWSGVPIAFGIILFSWISYGIIYLYNYLFTKKREYWRYSLSSIVILFAITGFVFARNLVGSLQIGFIATVLLWLINRK